MAVGRLELTALPDFPLVSAGDDLAGLIVESLAPGNIALEAGDIVAVAQKIVSKAENRLVRLDDVQPSREAVELACVACKDPRLVHVILSESRRVVRARPGVLITEHRLGFVMANAGVDQSNVAPADGIERVLLLPENPDASADNIRLRLEQLTGVRVGVLVTDSFGRPWRRGSVGVAIGVSGFPALVDKRGTPDLFGRELMVTEIGFADAIASAASLLMGEADEGRPVIVVRGLAWTGASGRVADLIRPQAEDLFR